MLELTLAAATTMFAAKEAAGLVLSLIAARALIHARHRMRR
jgi:hypothetical protein